MIWLDERLNDARLGAFVDPLESAYFSLPEVIVVAALLSALAVGCAALCAGEDERGVCPFAMTPLVRKKADAATKSVICAARAARVPVCEARLGVAFKASVEVEDCGMGDLLYSFNLRNQPPRRVMGWSVNCHSFVIQGWLVEEQEQSNCAMFRARKLNCCRQRSRSHI
jgi:hypothetical protein